MLENIVFSLARFENNFMNIEVKAVTSADAIKMLRQEGHILIDVRTPEEWKMIAASSLNSRDVIFLSLLTLPDGSINPRFMDDFMALKIEAEAKLLFICRSGGRSGYAAEICAGLGYECYNITDGIEALVSVCYPTINTNTTLRLDS